MYLKIFRKIIENLINSFNCIFYLKNMHIIIICISAYKITDLTRAILVY